MDRKWRRRLLEWTALGAAGAAATYWAYGWYRDRQAQLESGQERLPLQLLPLPLSASEGHGKSHPLLASASSSDVVQLESNMHSHFESVQEITQTQTIPEAMKLLRERLLELTALDAIMLQIRKLQASNDKIAAAEKLHLWQQLARTSFTRSLAACWLAPLLMLFLKIKINILGRHLYLESTLESLNARQPQAFTHGASRRPPLPPKLSTRAQEMFMHSSQHFLLEGSHIIHTKMFAVVEKVIGNMPLQQPVELAQVMRMLSDIMQEFERTVSTQDWAALLLGHDLQVPLCMPTPDGQLMTVIPVEGSMVDEMNAEVRAVLGGPHFHQALHSAVKHTTHIVVQHVQNTFNDRLSVARGVAQPVLAAATSRFATPMPAAGGQAQVTCQAPSLPTIVEQDHQSSQASSQQQLTDPTWSAADENGSQHSATPPTTFENQPADKNELQKAATELTIWQRESNKGQIQSSPKSRVTSPSDASHKSDSSVVLAIVQSTTQGMPTPSPALQQPSSQHSTAHKAVPPPPSTAHTPDISSPGSASESSAAAPSSVYTTATDASGGSDTSVAAATTDTQSAAAAAMAELPAATGSAADGGALAPSVGTTAVSTAAPAAATAAMAEELVAACNASTAAGSVAAAPQKPENKPSLESVNTTAERQPQKPSNEQPSKAPACKQPAEMPFARILPVVASGGDQLFGQHAGMLLQVVADLPAVRALCALVYVQGPAS